jgi:hypothetical protein
MAKFLELQKNPIFWCVHGLFVYRVCIRELSMYKVHMVHEMSVNKERTMDKIMDICGTSTYDQICDGFSLILPHLSVTISMKAKTFFRRYNFIAISTIQVCMETSMKLSLHVSSSS